MAVPLHGINQLRYQRLQSLAAQTLSAASAAMLAEIGVPPRRTAGWARASPCRAGLFPQQPDGVFAVVPGQSHELIEDPDLVTEGRAAITQLQC